MTRYILVIFVLFWGSLGFSQKTSNYGKAIITKNLPIYEYQDNFLPNDMVIYDMIMKHWLDEKSLDVIRNTNNTITIKNLYNDGFTGYEVIIELSSDLKINNISYNEWDDVENGSSTEYSVEKIILQLNKNPFYDSLITGYYSLQIKNEFIAGDILRNEGTNDTTFYSIFYGKFKEYSDTEVLLGRDWIEEQLEIKLGIRDEEGVYITIDKPANFKYGKDSLANILSNISINRSYLTENNSSSTILTFVVNENGNVETDNIEIRDGVKSDEVYKSLLKHKELWTNWIPAQYKCQSVKSKVSLRVRVK